MLLLSFCITVLAPVSEEMLFRAFLLPALQKVFGRWTAIILTTTIFAAAHLNLRVFLPIFVSSIVLCWIYERYQNIVYCMVAHMIWNMIALNMFFLL